MVEGRHQVDTLRYGAQLGDQFNCNTDAFPRAVVTGSLHLFMHRLGNVNAGHFLLQEGRVARRGQEAARRPGWAGENHFP